jgi:lipid-A-disaccharide synthase
MGIWSVIKNLSSIRSNLNFCKLDIIDFKPDALILVDYPAFNLKIAEFAKNNGLKVFYYISPKIWAWNESRISNIKKFVDHLLVIFPFEVDYYKKYEFDVTYVGNPLLDEINKKRYSFLFDTTKPIIALLPGSRQQEIEVILPVMLEVVESFPNHQFVIGAISTFSNEYYESFIKEKNVLLVFNKTYELLYNAKAALVTSGTATLEAALFKVPQVVCYKTNWFTYIIAKFVVKINYLSLVNILLAKPAVKELIQSNFKKENLIQELSSIINKSEAILNDYNRLINMLDKKGASKNAAQFIISSV